MTKKRQSSTLTAAWGRILGLREEALQLDIAKRRGELVDRQAFFEQLFVAFEAVLVQFRGQLLALPRRYSDRLEGLSRGQIEAVLREATATFYEDLSHANLELIMTRALTEWNAKRPDEPQKQAD